MNALLRTTLALLVLAATATGCTSTEGADIAGASSPCRSYDTVADQILQGAPAHTIVFIDQSSSVTESAAEAGPYREILRRLIEQSFSAPHSRLEYRLVHNRTTGAAGRRRFEQNLPIPRHMGLDVEMIKACKGYAGQVASLLREAWAEGQARLDSVYVPPENQRGTDLWGALEVASHFFRESELERLAAEDTLAARRQVVILSDLLQCTRGTRCFDNTWPKSRDEAEAWAEQDVEAIRAGLDVAPELLATAHFTLAMGEHSLSPKTQNVPYYWRALLGRLGVPSHQVAIQ